MSGSDGAWPEDPAPAEALTCHRCELADHRTRVVWGEGHPHAPVLIILDNPGAREDRAGRPFVCGTRLTLREALHRAGVHPAEVYVTYLIKCRPTRKYDKPAARLACRPFLEGQIANMAPSILVGLGDVVVQTLISPEASVRELRGRPLQLAGYPAIVSYHPLAARRRPNLLSYLASDLAAVALRLREHPTTG